MEFSKVSATSTCVCVWKGVSVNGRQPQTSAQRPEAADLEGVCEGCVHREIAPPPSPRSSLAGFVVDLDRLVGARGAMAPCPPGWGLGELRQGWGEGTAAPPSGLCFHRSTRMVPAPATSHGRPYAVPGLNAPLQDRPAAPLAAFKVQGSRAEQALGSANAWPSCASLRDPVFVRINAITLPRDACSCAKDCFNDFSYNYYYYYRHIPQFNNTLTSRHDQTPNRASRLGLTSTTIRLQRRSFIYVGQLVVEV